ncbi:TIGR01777 family protein [Enemella dayhoffiae]|uniref:TIGR01777 family protein n=1 Tax=Enemella dayhoffiae TaxID=2016507 RepID=A0A255H8U1_9ACTN|nr:TIGR01777 family oxidoreductase [Enemella dayhoffiae]OYO23957.1 TIGR01777 family protein [Enemella dayhoffiae]
MSRIAISGASGLIGTALATRLSTRHEVVRLVRRPARDTTERRWDPAAGFVEGLGLSDIDVVINLSGAGIADRRWSADRRRELLGSRLESTRTLAHLVATEERPSVLLSASAVGFYGNTGDREIDESAPEGEGFLADLCHRWEYATAEAVRSGVRTVLLRTGLVLDRRGGFLGRQLPLFRAGLGGPLGDGRQWLPWITLVDHVSACEHLIGAEVSGPVNLSAPHPVTNAELTAELGRVLHRPTRIPVPLPALRLALGPQLVDEALLTSNRMLPRVLTDSGYAFRHPSLAEALPAVLAA